MKSFTVKDKTLTIELDTAELNPQQVRLVKTINSLIAHIATTEDENDYFETCSALMKQVAAFVKQANFNDFPPYDEIPYAEQALEYSIDSIIDNIHSDKLNSYDN